MIKHVWRTKSGADERIRSGHPWVFAGELMSSFKGIVAGELVELQDHKGNFLARGYGNPHSQIVFRALTHRKIDIAQEEFYLSRLLQAWRVRKVLGMSESFRLCFGEGDAFPGLIIDYYLLEAGQLLAVQCSTAGVDEVFRSHPNLLERLCQRAFEAGLSEHDWKNTVVIARNDLSVRKLEGIAVEDPKVLHQGLKNFNPQLGTFRLGGIQLQTDFLQGQKTGFFLDQSRNIEMLCQILPRFVSNLRLKEIKIIDLCCYVGHWSARVAQVLRAAGIKVHVTLVDVSSEALARAKDNVSPFADFVECLKKDVMKDLEDLPRDGYDIVIVDPPAFIKARKDIPAGVAAYGKLFGHGFRIAGKQSLVVACSCSGLLDEENFATALRKGIVRSGKRARGILRGGHSPDHPVSPVFPEGVYLKMQGFVIEPLEELPVDDH